MKTVVLGMGNTILADDGVGIYIARAVSERIKRDDVDVKETSLAGIHVIDLLSGYEKAIILDAIRTEKGSPGEIYRLSPGDFKTRSDFSSAHHIDLFSALEVGRQLGEKLPEEIVIFAIEVRDTETFSELCTTEEVRAAIPLVAEMVADELA